MNLDCIWIKPAEPGFPECCVNSNHVADCEGELCDLYQRLQPHATSPPDRQMGDSTGIQCHVGECQCGHLAIYGIVRKYFGDTIPPVLLEEMDDSLTCAMTKCCDEMEFNELECNSMPPCDGWKSKS